MNYEQYAPLAIRTAKFISPEMDRNHAYMGMITEVGELVDAIKREAIYGKPLDLVNLKEEIGDVFWYLNLLWHTGLDKAVETMDFNFVDPEDPLDVMPKFPEGGAVDFVIHMAANVGSIATGSMPPSVLQIGLEYLCFNYDLSLSDVLETNIAKLAARYGDKYSDYAALNRDLTTERAVLESKVA